jgi:hypothetical protein
VVAHTGYKLLIGVPVGGLLLYRAFSNLDVSTTVAQTWPIRDAALQALELGDAYLLWSCGYNEASTLWVWAGKCRALRKELIE